MVKQVSGCEVGLDDGSSEGFTDAALLGEELGCADGLDDGSAEGLADVALDGCGLGCANGLDDGSAEGVEGLVLQEEAQNGPFVSDDGAPL